MAPLVMPSCASSTAMVASTPYSPRQTAGRTPAAASVVKPRRPSLHKLPVAVVDGDHGAGAIVEAVVVAGIEHEHAVHADDVRCLERIAQRGAKLRRAGLPFLRRFRNRFGEQQVGVPQVAAE